MQPAFLFGIPLRLLDPHKLTAIMTAPVPV
jgi:hypothetical protein